MFDWITQASLRNRMLVVAAYVVVLVVGILALRTVTLDVFPEFAPPQVVIQTEAPGVAPEDVERLITFPMETAINGTPGVDVIRSKSSAGLSTIVVVFTWDTDIYRARQLVGERLASVKEVLPPGTHDPTMLPVTSAVSWLVKYALVSDTVSPLELRTISDWDIARRLLAVPGVASVVSIGGGAKQYQVLLSSQKLWRYGVTVKDVTEALRLANVSVPGGFQVRQGQELAVTGVGRISSLDDLRQTVVAEREGTPITLDQVADVRFGPEFPRGDASYMGKPAVIGTVSKLYGADTLTLTYQVERALREIAKTLPPGVAIHTDVFRQASFIESAIRNLRRALGEGAVIVTVVVVFFLFNVRASVVTLTAMPLSLILGVLTLRYFGVGINSMTLGGLAIAIGAVVDDAIIYVENIVRRLRENQERPDPQPALDVVFQASREIRSSVVYATWIILVVFVPIFLLTGVEGRIFTPLGLAFTASLFASLIVAVTLTPVLCSLLLARAHGRPERESLTVRWLKTGYEVALRRVVGRPYTVLAVTLMLLAVAALLISTFGRSFLPEFQEGNFIIAVTTLPGTSLEESMRLGGRITAMLRRHPEVVSVAQRAGRSELDEDAQPPNFSEFDVTIRYGARDPEELVHQIREDFEQVPGVAVNVGQFIAHRLDEVLSGVRAQIAIKVYGPDLRVLRDLGSRVEAILREVNGIRDLQLEQQIDVPQIKIAVNREMAARLGLNPGDVLETAQIAFNGEVLSQVFEGQRTFPLFVWFDEASRGNADAMRNLLIDTPERRKVPLRMVADVEVEHRPYVINREKVQRRIAIQANAAGRDLGSVIDEARGEIAKAVTLPAGYFIEYGGQFESQQAATRVLTLYGVLALVATFLLLFTAFSSLRSALLVLANLPLALIGGVIAIFLTGRVMSVSSLIGFIGVFGIAARNGIILVSHYRQLRAEGRPKDEVILEGSKDRLAPVLMTAAAAALGVLPLVIGELAGKELERPMAHVILGGLCTSTFLNMLVVPTFFAKWGWETDAAFGRQTAALGTRWLARRVRAPEPVGPAVTRLVEPVGRTTGGDE
jgi:CzcA family heavy metal efflux pump